MGRLRTSRSRALAVCRWWSESCAFRPLLLGGGVLSAVEAVLSRATQTRMSVGRERRSNCEQVRTENVDCGGLRVEVVVVVVVVSTAVQQALQRRGNYLRSAFQAHSAAEVASAAELAVGQVEEPVRGGVYLRASKRARPRTRGESLSQSAEHVIHSSI
jgi:hypothetical protein